MSSHSEFADSMTLAEARDLLRGLVDEGFRCPCCSQMAKVYKRQIHSSMAQALILIWQSSRREWCEIAEVLAHRQVADAAKLRYWGLIEKMEGRRDDGSDRVGRWRITELGEQWVLGQVVIPKHARVYDGRCLQVTGDPTSIVEALGDRFNYRELMGGVFA